MTRFYLVSITTLTLALFMANEHLMAQTAARSDAGNSSVGSFPAAPGAFPAAPGVFPAQPNTGTFAPGIFTPGVGGIPPSAAGVNNSSLSNGALLLATPLPTPATIGNGLRQPADPVINAVQ